MGETKTITPDLKAQCIQEALDIKNAAAVARRHGLAPRVVQDWVQAAVKQGATEDPRPLKKPSPTYRQKIGTSKKFSAKKTWRLRFCTIS